MAIHNESLANQRGPEARKSSIYYCTTGEEIPLYEPCKDRKVRGISDVYLLVMDAGSPVAAFTARHALKAYLRRRLDAFINPLVYTFWDNQGTPSIMT